MPTLFEAIQKNNPDAFDKALDLDSVNEAMGPGGLKALHVAAFNDFPHFIEKLILNGADPYLLDDRNRTPLHTAALAQSFKVIDYLLSLPKGHELTSFKDFEGKTALHTLSYNGGLEGVLALLLHGADVNVEDGQGKTPLYLAIEAKHFNVEVIESLLKYGADPFHGDDNSPYKLAQRMAPTTIQELLTKKHPLEKINSPSKLSGNSVNTLATTSLSEPINIKDRLIDRRDPESFIYPDIKSESEPVAEKSTSHRRSGRRILSGS